MTFPLNGSIRTSPVKHNSFKHTNYTGNRLHASFLLSSLLPFVMRLNIFNSHHAAFASHSPAIRPLDSEAVLKFKELSAWPHMAEMTSVCDIIPAAPPGDATHEFRWASEMEWSGRRLWIKTEKRKLDRHEEEEDRQGWQSTIYLPGKSCKGKETTCLCI